MGGYPSVPSSSQGKRGNSSMETGDYSLENHSSAPSFYSRPTSSTRSHSESSILGITTVTTHPTPTLRKSILKKTASNGGGSLMANNNGNGGGGMDIFSIEPENLYKQHRVLQESSSSSSTSSSNNSKTPLITLDSSNSQTPYRKRTPMIQKDESAGLSVFGQHSPSHHRGRNVIIEERSFTPPQPHSTNNGGGASTFVSSPKNHVESQQVDLHIGIPVNHSSSVRLAKKKTKTAEIDAILNQSKNNTDPYSIPPHPNQRFDKPITTENKVFRKTPQSDPNTRMAKDVDKYINSLTQKDIEPESNINDFKQASHPHNSSSLSVTSSYQNRRRKSTTVEEVDEIEKQLEALKRSRSSLTNKRRNIPPVNNPMIVVVGGNHTLTRDSSLYNVGGVISDKKKVELEKRKSTNRRKSYTFDMDNEEDSVADDEDEYNFELETACSTEYTESDLEN